MDMQAYDPDRSSARAGRLASYHGRFGAAAVTVAWCRSAYSQLNLCDDRVRFNTELWMDRDKR